MRLTAPLPRLAAVAFALALPGAAAAQDAALAAAEARLQQDIERSGAPGVAVAVVRGDRVIYSRGFGVASTDTKTPVTGDTLFQIGSATKMLTAVAVMSAHTTKAIDVDAPVSRYVSGLTACVGAPTVRQLLSHTGGLMDEPDEFGPQGEEGLAAYPRTWTTEYCLLPPGRAFSYSNSGFALAGLALQEAGKKPFADIVKARVLEPLGMTRTTFRPTEAMTWPLAIGHRRDNAGAFTAVRPLPNDARLWPAGTVYSSAQEMARFVVALLNDGRTEGRQALPAGLAATVRTSVAAIPTTGERYGLGQFLTERTFGHGGTMTGYTAQVTIDHVAGVGIVVLSNGDNAALTPIVQTLLLAAGVAPAPSAAPPIAAGGVLPDLEAYVGTYRNPRRFTVEVSRSGDGLMLKRFGRDFPLRPSGPDRFVTDLPRGGTETIAFGRGANGRADYLQMNVWALARVTTPVN
jgi:CubicO group peptidase (beta-lactamase class C family)